MKKAIILLFSISIAFLILSFALKTKKTIKGKVMSDLNSIPLAVVRIEAEDESILCDYYGDFHIQVPEEFDSINITAWAEGYFNGNSYLYPNDTFVNIHLNRLYDSDNTDYVWLSPEKDENKPNNCGNCHADVLMNQWGNNAHANSAKNPFFLAIYYGKDTSLSVECGEGYKKDFPQTKGNCSTCHIPVAAVHDPWGIDPISVNSTEKNGVFCDVCHKIQNVNISSGQGTTGVLSIDFLRPPEGKQMFFGPYTDIHEPDAYLPLIKKSQFCAACHTGKFWGTEAYNSFNEWKNSPYPQMGIECQTCHMAPDGITTNFAPGNGGLERNPLSIPSHLQPGSRDPKILSDALTMNMEVQQINDSVRVTVILYNDKTGHHVPTDRPSRNMILLVNAINEEGNTLTYISEEKIPWWGGEGNVIEGNYSGYPGKGFAKILQDFEGNAPSPSWRPSVILTDNRIAAFDADTSYYYFQAPNSSSFIKIKAELIYRRFFKSTMNEKGFDIDDITMEKDSLIFNTQNIVSIKSNSKRDNFSFTLAPNPASDFIILKSKHQLRINRIEICSLSGRILDFNNFPLQYSSQENYTFNISRYQAGTYVCKIYLESSVQSIKFIKY